MPLRRVWLVLLLAPLASATPRATAASVLAAAKKAQGGLTHDALEDLRIEFKGHTVIEGQGTRTVGQRYWYRTRDRAFRLLTWSRAAADRARSELGVYRDAAGKERFWERAGKTGVIRLQRGNRDDSGSIRAIRQRRADFEGMLHMVLLARLLDGRTHLSLAADEPVVLERDLPHEAVAILGRDRAAHRYHVVDCERPGEARLRLFVRTDDYTVRKAVQYRRDDPRRVAWVYYFGPYPARVESGPKLPYFFSAHTAVPVDEKSRDSTTQAYGEIRVELNHGLADDVFAPPSA